MKTFLHATLGLLPLILFWTLSGFGMHAVGLAAGLVGAVLLNLWRLRSDGFRALEVVGLATLGLIAIAYLAAPDLTWPHAVTASFALIGVFFLATVAVGRPWTADYSRAAFAHVAKDKAFLQINALISGVWGFVFLVYAAGRHLGWPIWTLIAVTIAAKLATIVGPGLLARALLLRRARGEESWRWPRPALVSGKSGQGYDVAVIGAGIGGLTCAALLADAGAKVLVVEQHVVPGGFCHHWNRMRSHNGVPRLFRFDSGVHDFSGVWPGGPIDSVARQLGLAIDWLRLDHTYYIRGRRIDVPRDARAYAALLGREFPDAAAGIAALFDDVKAVFDGMYSTGAPTGGIPLGPRDPRTLLAFPKAHPIAYAWMERPFAELVNLRVKDEGAREMIYALAGYVTHAPKTMSVADMAPLFGYYFHGGYYPRGGSGVFSQALADAVTKRGGTVMLKNAVREVIVADGAARGIALSSGERIAADCVVSNADIRRTFLDLVPAAHLPRGFRETVAASTPAASALAVHLAVDFVPQGNPIIHIGDGGMGTAIMLPSIVDPSAAPEGYGTIELLRLLPPRAAEGWFEGDDAASYEPWRRSEAYKTRKAQACDALVDAAAAIFPDLRAHIVMRVDATPVTFARYDWSSLGAIYGVVSADVFKGTMSPLRGLYLAGAGNFGPGIEAVLISGARTAEEIMPGLLGGTRGDGPQVVA